MLAEQTHIDFHLSMSNCIWIDYINLLSQGLKLHLDFYKYTFLHKNQDIHYFCDFSFFFEYVFSLRILILPANIVDYMDIPMILQYI